MLGRGPFLWILVGLTVNVFGCVTSAPDTRGIQFANSAERRGDSKTIEEIRSAFTRFEQALQQRDLEGVMALYAERYRDRQFTKDDLKEEWQQALATYHSFSATHLITRVEAHSDNAQPTAFVTCSGSISAVSNATGTRVILDSWIGEVHRMVEEKGRWRILVNASDERNPVDVRIASHQHHQ